MNQQKPYLAVILIQVIYAGMFLLSKAAFDGGMNNFVFIFYRQAFATILLVPLSLKFEWKQAPPLTFLTFCKIFMLSLFGITLSLDLYGVALIYTSATLAAATTNTLPVITFILAVLLRMETVRIRSVGVAKVIGILICMGGVASLAFYKGPQFKLFCIHHHHNTTQHQAVESHDHNNTWIKGCFLMITSNICWGLWLVLQAFVLRSYPSKLLFTALQCLFSSVQSFVIAIAFVRDPLEWRLGFNLRLLAVLYCGFVVTGISFYLQAWVIEKKGPVFLAMSTPLTLVFTMITSLFLLCETLTLGRVLGGVLLIGGLYSVLWGKSKEQRIEEKSCVAMEQLDIKVVPFTDKTPSSPLMFV